MKAALAGGGGVSVQGCGDGVRGRCAAPGATAAMGAASDRGWRLREAAFLG